MGRNPKGRISPEGIPPGQPPQSLGDNNQHPHQPVWWATLSLDHMLPVGHLVKHLTGLVAVKQVI